MPENNRSLGWVLLLTLAFLWGSSFYMLGESVKSFSPLQVAGIRLVVAALCLLPISLRYLHQIKGKTWFYLALAGFVGSGIPAFLFALSMTKLNSATGGILNSLTPIWVLVIGALFFRLTITTNKILGVLIGFAGAAWLALSGGDSLSVSDRLFYALMAIVGTVCYGLNVNIIKGFLNEINPIALAGFAFIITSIPYVGYLIFSDIPQAWVDHPDQATTHFIYILILGVACSALSLSLFGWLVQLTDQVFSSSVTYLIPIFALMWSMIGGEVITWQEPVAMVIILAGVYLANMKTQTK